MTLLPDFLVIGAPKAGTTSLYRWLRQHPQLFLPAVKETNHFAFRGRTPSFPGWGRPPAALMASVTDPGDYARLFEGSEGASARGEVSPLYLFSPEAPEAIARTLPGARLLAVLRNPADRAFSHYLHLRRDGREPCLTFEEALEKEEDRRRQGWSWDYYYAGLGFYGEQLSRYLEHFPRGRILLFLFDDMEADPGALVREVLAFLEVDQSLSLDTSRRYNVSGIPRLPAFQRLLASEGTAKRVIRALTPAALRRRLTPRLRDLNLQRPALRPETRRRLFEGYAGDLAVLEGILGRSLEEWRP